MAKSFVTIPGFPDYEMAADGSVRRCVRSPRSSADRIMSAYKHKDGYRMVGLSRNGKRYQFIIAHLLLLVFNGPRPTSEHEARHLDGDKSNDALNNLEWGTRKQNIRDALRHGTFRRGAAHPNARLTQEQAARIRYFHTSGYSQSELARQFKVNRSSINRIITNLSYRREWVDQRITS